MANEFWAVMPTKEYEAQLRQLPESTKTLLPFITREDDKVGEEAYFNQIGSMTARKGKVRFGKHEKDQATFKRRRITPDFAYLATEIDSKDQVETLVNPRSALAMNVKHALARQIGQDVITAMFGTAFTGKAGGTSETFNASDIVGVQVGGAASNVGLNADKIVAGIQKIQDLGFDLSDPRNELTMLQAPQQASDAKLDTTLQTFDNMTGKILSGIDIPDGFMGIRNILTDPMCPYANDAATGVNSSWNDAGLANDDAAGNDVRMVILFIKSGVSYAMWKNPIVRVDELQEQHYDWQLYSAVHYGITRMHAAGAIVGILCDESP